jgi:hypothetical protein
MKAILSSLFVLNKLLDDDLLEAQFDSVDRADCIIVYSNLGSYFYYKKRN